MTGERQDAERESVESSILAQQKQSGNELRKRKPAGGRLRHRMPVATIHATASVTLMFLLIGGIALGTSGVAAAGPAVASVGATEGSSPSASIITTEGGVNPIYYTHCEAVSDLGAVWAWVPELIVSAPFEGSVTGTTGSYAESELSIDLPGMSWTWDSGSAEATSLSASNGATSGIFELTEWTVYSDKNYTNQQVILGDGACTTPYLTQITDSTGWVQTDSIVTADQGTTTLPNTISMEDTGVNTPVYGQQVKSISGLSSFSYSTDNDAGVGTCSGPAPAEQVTKSTFASTTFGIDLSVNDNYLSVDAGVNFEIASGSDTSFSYGFSTDYNWLFDSLTGSSGGQLAFSAYDCPGGGGCVAYGTPILTPEGYRPVQDLGAGIPVEEYNFTSHQLMEGKFLSANLTTSNDIVSVNHGQLVLTATDQPVFIRNATYTGWIRDPQNLTTSDFLFDPINGSWIPVVSVGLEHGDTKVYDVITSDANNFVANGALLDIKAG
jgi:hypothetical protein